MATQPIDRTKAKASLKTFKRTQLKLGMGSNKNRVKDLVIYSDSYWKDNYDFICKMRDDDWKTW